MDTVITIIITEDSEASGEVASTEEASVAKVFPALT